MKDLNPFREATSRNRNPLWASTALTLCAGIPTLFVNTVDRKAGHTTMGSMNSSGSAPVSERRSRDDTSDAIRHVAVRLFAEQGFAATSVRDIAKQAGADPALVIRYFGSKEHLFLETMTVENPVRPIAQGPLPGLGEEILRVILMEGGRARQVYTALMRAADRPDVRSYLLRANEAQLVIPVAERLTGESAHLRATLIAAQVNGLLNSLWILEEPTLVAMSTELLVRTYGSALQTLVDG